MTLEELRALIEAYNGGKTAPFHPSENALQSMLRYFDRLKRVQATRTWEEAFAQGFGRLFDENTYYQFYFQNPTYGVADDGYSMYIIPKDELDIMIEECGGDPNSLEFLLGKPQGSLGDEYVVTEVHNTEGIRIVKPTGEEATANSFYNPNGLTGGTSEAVAYDTPNPNWGEKPIGSDTLLNSGDGTTRDVHLYYEDDYDYVDDDVIMIEEAKEEEEESEENGTVEVETEVKVEEKTTVEETEDSVTVTSETTTTTTTTTTENKEEDDGMDDA